MAIAVDFAKHGKKVNFDVLTENKYNIEQWPDFFEKVEHKKEFL